MNQDQCSGVAKDGSLEDLAGMHDGPVEGTHRDDVRGGDLVAGVQQQDAESLRVQFCYHELPSLLRGLQRSGQSVAEGGPFLDQRDLEYLDAADLSKMGFFMAMIFLSLL